MRSARSLLLADPLPPLSQGFEALVIRAELMIDRDVHLGQHVERHLTVFLMLDPDEASRRQLRSFAARFIAAQTTFVTELADLPAASESIACGDTGDVPVSLVLALPPHDQAAARLVDQLVERVVGGKHSHALCIAVATDTSAWVGLRKFGFVQSKSGALFQTGLWILESVCSLMAPIRLSAFDAHEIRQCCGSASSPSLLLSLNEAQATDSTCDSSACGSHALESCRSILVRANTTRELTTTATYAREQFHAYADSLQVVCVGGVGLLCNGSDRLIALVSGNWLPRSNRSSMPQCDLPESIGAESGLLRSAHSIQ